MSNENDIAELRSHLFDTLRGLKNGEMDIDRAKAINDTAQTIINSAKVEVDFVRATGAKGSGFLLPGESKPPLPPGVTGTKTHRLVG